MSGATVEVATAPDGTVVIRPHGTLGVAHADELRRALVQTVRHTRPAGLVLDLHDVGDVDPINLGTLAAACQLGDDHNVPVVLDHCSPAIAGRLIAAGVPADRLRRAEVPRPRSAVDG